MNIVTWDEFIADAGEKGYSAAIGVFDGFHKGHQKLIDTIKNRPDSGPSLVVTFKDNPKKILHPSTFKGDIYTREAKLELLSASKVDTCALIDFSRNFGTLSGVDFMRILARSGVERVCVGPNFRCGYKMDTDVSSLRNICPNLGMDLEIVDPVQRFGHPVSSSRIRNAILEGDLDGAKEMLGRPLEIPLARGQGEKSASAAAAAAAADVAEAAENVFALEASVLHPPEGYYLVMLTAEGALSAPILAEGRLGQSGLRLETAIDFSGEGKRIRGITFIKLLSKG